MSNVLQDDSSICENNHFRKFWVKQCKILEEVTWSFTSIWSVQQKTFASHWQAMAWEVFSQWKNWSSVPHAMTYSYRFSAPHLHTTSLANKKHSKRGDSLLISRTSYLHSDQLLVFDSHPANLPDIAFHGNVQQQGETNPQAFVWTATSQDVHIPTLPHRKRHSHGSNISYSEVSNKFK